MPLCVCTSVAIAAGLRLYHFSWLPGLLSGQMFLDSDYFGACVVCRFGREFIGNFVVIKLTPEQNLLNERRPFDLLQQDSIVPGWPVT